MKRDLLKRNRFSDIADPIVIFNNLPFECINESPEDRPTIVVVTRQSNSVKYTDLLV